MTRSTEAGISRASPIAQRFEMTDQEFDRICAVVKREAGIHLTEAKRALVAGRLARRLRTLNVESYGDYARLAVADPGGELREMIDCITTNETHFFRQPDQFTYLEQVIIPAWIRDADAGAREKHIKVWSAGCSTGEEPFTVAMILKCSLPAQEGWDVSVVGTDISRRVLAQASSATWRIERASDIPSEYLTRYMKRGVRSQLGFMRATEELRNAVSFQPLNLVSESLDCASGFDIVLCRNVLIYFADREKRAIVSRLVDSLKPDGYMFLGHAESLIASGGGTRAVAPSIRQCTR